MLKKILKWSATTIAALIAIAVVALAVNGLPRPGAISADGVPRMPWKPAIQSFQAVRQIMTNVSFQAWRPAKPGILVRAFDGMKPQLHRIENAGGDLSVVTSTEESPGQVHMNPDPERNYIVFGMDVGGSEFYQLYRLDLADGAIHPLTDGDSRNLAGEFDRAGGLLAYTSTRRNGEDSDIYLIDPEHPESDRLLTEVEGSWYPGDWSPDGGRFLVGHYISINETSIHLLDIETGVMEPLFPDETEPAAYSDALWSLDGRAVYFVSDRGSEFRTLRRVDLESGEVEHLTADIRWDVEEIDISPDGRHLALVINEDGVTSLRIMELETGVVRPVEGISDGLVNSVQFHQLRNEVAWTHRTPSGLSVPCSYDIESDSVKVWTEATPSEFPSPRLVHFPTFDSVEGEPRMISAFLAPPEEQFPPPWPVLISIHGGPESQATPILSPMFNILREHGIAILVPNVRGSSGYGKSFLKLDNGYLREDSVKDIGALLDWIETEPDLEQERVGLFGGSYGGYMVLASAVHFSERLRCAINFFGISNFVTFLENTEDYRRDLRRAEYGDERDPEMRSFLESISPLNQAEKIGIPLLVYSGLNDPRVPVSESRRIAEIVRQQGGEVWYIEAANEGHSLAKPMNLMYVGSAALAFNERHLLGE
jgi:dipeptidyl aminopeptidase/acylaminoacyl peptidase